MKKILVLAFVGILTLGMSEIAGAIVYEDTEAVSRWLSGKGTTAWYHQTPTDFEVPYDIVNSATLTVSAWGLDKTGARVDVEGVAQGALVNGEWYFLGWSWSQFDIGDVFVGGWPNGQALNVSLVYNTSVWSIFNSLYLADSKFTLDYTNGTADPAPVPEPSTMLLLGTGLLGLASAQQRIRNRSKAKYDASRV